jgi:hypothetical protein
VGTDKYSVGAPVEAWCTKCKLDRLHTIESLKSDGNIHRVLCRTCEGVHLFRRPKTNRSKGLRHEPQVLTSEDLSKAKRYAFDGKYEVGDIIKHKVFGPGRVLEVRPGGKMEVGFESGSKLLVCR